MCSSRASTATEVEGETPRAGAAEAPRRVPEYKVRRNAQGGAGSGATRSKAQVSCAGDRSGPGSSRPAPLVGAPAADNSVEVHQRDLPVSEVIVVVIVLPIVLPSPLQGVRWQVAAARTCNQDPYRVLSKRGVRGIHLCHWCPCTSGSNSHSTPLGLDTQCRDALSASSSSECIAQ